jgi:glycerol-3-phosphate cytidylyltransferase
MIIYTGGSFDGLHVGHLELLASCRELAGPMGRVVVSLNTDSFIERYKGKAPRFNYAARKELLSACRYVDLVVRNLGSEQSGYAIDVVQPDLLAIGDDWASKDYLGQLGISQEWLDERELKIVYVPRTRGVSSSALRALG